MKRVVATSDFVRHAEHVSTTRHPETLDLGPLTSDVTPDLRSARRVVSQARRVECVEILRSSNGVSARMTGVWHRLPVTRPVPVATAVGLSMQGVRTVVLDEAVA